MPSMSISPLHARQILSGQPTRSQHGAHGLMGCKRKHSWHETRENRSRRQVQLTKQANHRQSSSPSFHQSNIQDKACHRFHPQIQYINGGITYSNVINRSSSFPSLTLCMHDSLECQWPGVETCATNCKHPSKQSTADHSSWPTTVHDSQPWPIHSSGRPIQPSLIYKAA